jgi:hydrogenase nickel incorporation protein HypA/HybF
MHELSIAMSILDVAGEEAERRGVQVLAVRLKLGPLSGVIKEALLSAYEMAREDSLLPESELIIEEVPIVVHCLNCERDVPAESIQQICCSICGTPTPDVVSGRELEVTGLEVRDLPQEEQSARPAAETPEGLPML